MVDLRFREQFEITHPTDGYAVVLAAVPEHYVGPVSRIIPIVQVRGVAGCGRGGRWAPVRPSRGRSDPAALKKPYLIDSRPLPKIDCS